MQIIRGLQVFKKKIVGYRIPANWDGDLSKVDAVYEVRTSTGTKYLIVDASGAHSIEWGDEKPGISQENRPKGFPKDPWKTMVVLIKRDNKKRGEKK
jgi:hypothetical protein